MITVCPRNTRNDTKSKKRKVLSAFFREYRGSIIDHHFDFRISGLIKKSGFYFCENFTSIKSDLPASVISMADCIPGANAYIFRNHQKIEPA
jgi:hypothetical protein